MTTPLGSLEICYSEKIYTLEKAASRAKKTPAEAAVTVERVASTRSKVLLPPAVPAAINDG